MTTILSILFIALCLITMWALESKDVNSEWGDEDE